MGPRLSNLLLSPDPLGALGVGPKASPSALLSASLGALPGAPLRGRGLAAPLEAWASPPAAAPWLGRTCSSFSSSSSFLSSSESSEAEGEGVHPDVMQRVSLELLQRRLPRGDEPRVFQDAVLSTVHAGERLKRWVEYQQRLGPVSKAYREHLSDCSGSAPGGKKKQGRGTSAKECLMLSISPDLTILRQGASEEYKAFQDELGRAVNKVEEAVDSLLRS